MYSSKEKHKWQNALFLTGPYVDAHKEKLDSRYQGKQFATKPLRMGNAGMNGVLFSTYPVFDSNKYAEPYDVGNKYLKTHPIAERKLGFGTHDAPKRDEFMSGQRALQYKDSMRAEEVVERQAAYRNGDVQEKIQQLEQKVKEIHQKYPDFDPQNRDENDYCAKVPKVLYDIGQTEDGTTPVFLRDTRDKFYSRKRCNFTNKPRHVQTLCVTSGDYGLNPKPIDKLKPPKSF